MSEAIRVWWGHDTKVEARTLVESAVVLQTPENIRGPASLAKNRMVKDRECLVFTVRSDSPDCKKLQDIFKDSWMNAWKVTNNTDTGPWIEDFLGRIISIEETMYDTMEVTVKPCGTVLVMMLPFPKLPETTMEDVA